MLSWFTGREAIGVLGLGEAASLLGMMPREERADADCWRCVRCGATGAFGPTHFEGF
ncbi:hypothetical protein GCM10022215_36940 [Nocardioides fonticola]|uniref:Uncharacterized protein n=1 Tax=Nocardioides fonticola TaxID=450363 RepID=A0ABP7XVZ8_9ACTN